MLKETMTKNQSLQLPLYILKSRVRMNIRQPIVFMLGMFVAICATTALAQGPVNTSQKIPFCGTAPGQPDGSTDLTFKLYNAAVGGTYLGYTDSADVDVAGEAFCTVLGTGEPVPASIFEANPSVHIAIALTSTPDMEIGPREPIYAAGFAQNALTIADNAVTTPKIAANAVTTAKIAANAVTTPTIAPNAVTTAQIAPGAVTADRTALLPYSQSLSSSSPAWQVTNAGSGTALAGLNMGTGRAGFFQNTNPANPNPALHATTAGGEAVYGETSSINGIAVSGRATHPSGLTAGVQGLSDSTSGKGVFGYASKPSGTTYGVLGESRSTSGRGVFGYASRDSSGTTYGVHGKSDSTSDKAAGVLAQGNGVTPSGIPRAAALEINNGSIRVAGATTPAGKWDFGAAWALIFTSPPSVGPGHLHGIGWSQEVIIKNPLITKESYILVTAKFSEAVKAGSTAIISQAAGQATVAVSLLGGPFPDPPGTPPSITGFLNYLIINP